MKPQRGKIFLIGYRASGKTSVGRILARALGWGFRDLDRQVEMAAGITIAEMVARYGWERFRQEERGALEEALADEGNMVVACGGGAVLHRDLWPEALARFRVIWLRARVDTVLERMASDPGTGSMRPALEPGRSPEEEVLRTMGARRPLYRAFSHFAVDTDGKSSGEVAGEILDMLGAESRAGK